jgi:hypothetical protein
VKAKNMKVGVEVVIKKCAEGTASDFIGMVGEITSSDEDFVCWVNVDGENFPCNPYELRLVNKGDAK